MKHKCHAVGCEATVEPSKLMCLRHWRMVPPPIQDKVWKTYRKGQERTKGPSREYVAAAREAINKVAEIETSAV